MKPSQFVGSQHGEVVDVQDHSGENAGMVEQGEHEQVSEGLLTPVMMIEAY